MKRTDIKNQRQRKIGLIFISIALVVIIVFACFLILNHGNSKTGEENTSEKSVAYTNDDYSYHPSIDQIDFDYNENIMYFNNLLIVYTFNKLDEEAIEKLTDSVDGTLVGNISGSVNALQIKVKESSLEELNEMADVLMKDENVLFAGYDYPMQMFDSSDPWSDDAQNPQDDIGNEENPDGNDWWAEAIGAYTAWDNLDDVAPIKVGIIDSGFDVDHDDLKGKISFLDDYKMNSEDNHGTHVAGLIGAISDNEIGIRGIVDKVDLVCVDWSPITNDTNDVRYVNYLSTGEYIETTKRLIENGVKVINNSWGTHILSKEGFTQDLYGKSSDLLFLLQYFAVHETGAYDSYLDYIKAHAKRTGLESMLILIELMLNNQEDFIIVQAAGNGYDNGGKGYEAENSGFYCTVNNSLYNILSEDSRNKLLKSGINYSKIKDHIFIVGAVENKKSGGNYKMTSFSNFGSSVDICAPGKGIFSTITNNDYELESGTSMAAPIVAGSIALVWSNDSSLTASQVKNIIINGSSSKAIGVGDDAGTEYPMLNLGNSVLSQKILSPESAVNIYLKNKSVWMAYPEYFPMNGYSYGFLDLDFDGNLELICNINDGSGRYSYNTYYQINKSDYTVSKIQFNNSESEDGGGYDYSFFNGEYPKILKSKNNESNIYLCADHLRVTTGEYQEYYGTLSLNSNELTSEILFSEYHCEPGIEGNTNAVDKYYYVDNGNYIGISEKSFSEMFDAFYSKYTDLNLKWKTVSGKDLELASMSKQKELLLDTYTAFSYDGFSFDNIKIVNADIKIDEDENMMTLLLNNIWENNIQAHNEYTFKSDGSLIENPNEFPRYLNYTLNGDILTITWDGEYTTKLKYVNKNSDIDWEEDSFFYYNVYFDLGEYENFFYQMDYVPDEFGLNNVMWLRMKHESNSSLS